MAARSPVGGGNLIEFFALGTNVFGTKQTHVEDKTKSLKVTGHPRTNKVSFDIDARHGDTSWETFLQAYATSVDLSLLEEFYENGDKDSSTAATTSNMFGYVVYFGTLGTTRKTFIGVGVLSGEAGSTTTGYQQFEQTPLTINGMAAPATYTLTATIVFNTSKVSTTGVPTQLVSGSYGTYVFLTAA